MKIKTLKLEGNRFITENDQDDTIGEIKEDGTVVKEYFGQGLIYKNFKNFEQKSGPCYIAEYQGEQGDSMFHNTVSTDELNTKNFNDMVEGEDYETYNTIIEAVKSALDYNNMEVTEEELEQFARDVFYEVDWQGVFTLANEWLENSTYFTESKKLKEAYSLVGIYTDEHGMEKRDIIKSFENKEDVDKYMEENEEELKAKNYDKMITESKKVKEESKDYKSMSVDNIIQDKLDGKKVENAQKYNTIYRKVTENKSTNRARKLKLETKQNKKQLNVKNYKSNSVIFLDDEDGETEGSFDLDFDGVEFDNKEEFEEYCKENIVNRLNVNLGDIDEDSLENAIQTLYIGHNHRITESVSQNITDEIYEAADFTELLDTLDNMKQDAKVQRARNLTSHAYTHIPDEEEDERLDEIKDEVISILTESYKDGWKPELDLYKRDIEAIVNSLGISPNEVQKEADAIKFRYNGKVYFAEPVSMYQVDVFDDNHNQIGYGVNVEKIKGEVFTKFTDNDYLYELVGGEYAGTYTREEAEKLPIKELELTDDLSDTRANGGFVHRKELDNQLQFKGYLGPMWNGTQDGKAVIRYETQQVYNQLSK